MIRENPFQEHPIKQLRKRLSRMIIALPTRSLNKTSHVSAIIMEHPGTLVRIAISGQPFNKAVVCHPFGVKINSNSLWPLLENFLRLPSYSQTSMDSTLLLIYLNKILCKKKVLHPGLPSGRKNIPSDSFTFLFSCMVVWCVLSQSSLFIYLFFIYFFYILLCLFWYIV